VGTYVYAYVFAYIGAELGGNWEKIKKIIDTFNNAYNRGPCIPIHKQKKDF